MKKYLIIMRHIIGITIPTLVVAGAVYAGSLTPLAGTPSGTGYTLGDIYIRLTTNATSTAGGHDISSTSSPSSTFNTLTEIYNAIPTIYSGDFLASSTYLGVKGTALSHQYNGTCQYTEAGHNSCLLGTEFVGGTQANGGVDDFNGYNLGGAPPSGRYATTWTTCTVGNNYCDTGDVGANAKDNATGMIWSYPCQGSGCGTWDTSSSSALTAGCIPGGSCAYYSTDTYYSWSNVGPDNAGMTAQQLCSSHTGWSLPHQKQLMQAYIDGSYGNLEPEGIYRNYWSATTGSYYPSNAWFVSLSDGYTYGYTKSYPYFAVRCVRE
jgi:Protein of unknown function (DUF1566)